MVAYSEMMGGVVASELSTRGKRGVCSCSMIVNVATEIDEETRDAHQLWLFVK